MICRVGAGYALLEKPAQEATWKCYTSINFWSHASEDLGD